MSPKERAPTVVSPKERAPTVVPNKHSSGCFCTNKRNKTPCETHQTQNWHIFTLQYWRHQFSHQFQSQTGWWQRQLLEHRSSNSRRRFFSSWCQTTCCCNKKSLCSFNNKPAVSLKEGRNCALDSPQSPCYCVWRGKLLSSFFFFALFGLSTGTSCCHICGCVCFFFFFFFGSDWLRQNNSSSAICVGQCAGSKTRSSLQYFVHSAAKNLSNCSCRTRGKRTSLSFGFWSRLPNWSGKEGNSRYSTAVLYNGNFVAVTARRSTCSRCQSHHCWWGLFWWLDFFGSFLLMFDPSDCHTNTRFTNGTLILTFFWSFWKDYFLVDLIFVLFWWVQHWMLNCSLRISIIVQQSHIPGRTFPVKEIFLEDILEFTGYTPEDGSDFKLKGELPRSVPSAPKKLPTLEGDDEDNDTEQDLLDCQLTVQELKARDPKCQKRTLKTLQCMDEENKVNFDLIEGLVVWLARSDKLDGAVLVFLAGLAEITAVYDRLIDNAVVGKSQKF